MKLIIFDFEVFKYDTLLGIYIVDNEDRSKKTLYQTWDKENIKKLYQLFKDNIWIGHNNKFYDNLILEAILKDQDTYLLSKEIVENNKKKWLKLPLNWFDLNEQVMIKLKMTEAYWGKNIDILNEVDWNIDRPLNEQEKKRTEQYNKSDLDQTYDNFMNLQSTFDLKLNIMKEFNLDYKVLNQSSSNISAYCLKVKKDDSKLSYLKPYIFPQLKIHNKEVWDWYISQKFRTESKVITINEIEHQIGIGGIHGARNTWYSNEKKKENSSYISKSTDTKTILYCDVSGYYNLLMINYDLFSRSMSSQSKNFYTKLYHEQLALKGIDDTKRETFKCILLAVFGAMRNEYTEFYDPFHFDMVTLNGQLFLIDLLEKLDSYITLIQSNTDGIIFEYNNRNELKIKEIIDEWENRTKFTLKREKIKKIYQRDVNNYLIEKENDKVVVKGEALKYSDVWNTPFFGFGSFKYKDPLIISILMKKCLLNNVLPEVEIDKWKDKLWLFQFIVNKQSYKQLILSQDNEETILPEINRVFPSNKNIKNMIYKIDNSKKVSKVKVANLPDRIFIYNNDILSKEIIEKLQKEIDWQWYINRTYIRLGDFLGIKNEK